MDTAERSNLRMEGSLLCLKTGFLGLNCFNQKKNLRCCSLLKSLRLKESTQVQTLNQGDILLM